MNDQLTHLLYFLSALAQCAAAFEALVGFFGIFRLQTNAAILEERYREAQFWLFVYPQIHYAEQLPPREKIKEWLGKISNGEMHEKFSSEARGKLLKITEAENENNLMRERLLPILKIWACVFILSIANIPFVFLCVGIWGYVACMLYIFLAGVALFLTWKFMQDCLVQKMTASKQESIS